MPKYLLLITESEEAYEDAGNVELAAIMDMHRDFSQRVVEAGASILGGEALQPVATATFLRNTRSADVQVVDNPAPELKEIFGGYYLIEAADDAQAIELAKECPAPAGYIEVRPVWDIPDLD